MSTIPRLHIKEQNVSSEDLKLSARQRRRTKKRPDIGEDSGVCPIDTEDSVTTSFSNLLAVTDPNGLSVQHDSSKKKESTIPEDRSARARRSNSKRKNVLEKSLPAKLPPLRSDPTLPLSPYRTPLPPIKKGNGLPQRSLVPSPLPPLQTSMEDSTTKVVDILRKKLEMDSSEAGNISTTEEKRVDKKHRRKKRSPAKKQLKPSVSDGSDSKEGDGNIELVERSGLNDNYSVDDLSSHHLRDLPGTNLDELNPGVAADKDDAAARSEVDMDSAGRPLPTVNPNTESSQDTTAPPGELPEPPGELEQDAAAATIPPVSEEMYKSCKDVLGISVHCTDELKPSVFLAHPCIKISIMDIASNGNLLKKSTPDKCVTSYYESGNPSVDYILPVLTQPYDCREHRRSKGIFKACWEEMLLFNDLLVHFTENPNVVLFFELVDFVRGNCAGGKNRNKPWHQVAWAFLRPTGTVCKSKFGQKIRLQFYKYKRKRFYRTTESAEVYTLWSTGHRSRYPSTLNITLQAVPINSLPEYAQTESSGPIKRSMFPLQEEKGTLTLEELAEQKESLIHLAVGPSEKWASRSSRLPDHPCKIPMSVVASLAPTRTGCSVLAFSHSGHVLAAGCVDQNDLFPLLLLKVPSLEPVHVLEGHRGIIYSLCWDPGDSLLVSASADSIVKVWSMNEATMEAWSTLPHPCYVYCACFMSAKDERPLVATGAYDGYVRMWDVEKGTAQVVAEFQVSSSRINCMCWSSRRQFLFTGDSSGTLNIWRKKDSEWKLKKSVDLIDNQPIASICIHPNGRNVLLHSYKQTLSMVDLRINSVCCNFTCKVSSGSERCGSFISPCGSLVFAGAYDGEVHVWNSTTGELEHVYDNLPFTSAVGCLAYHPSEHMLVISAFGSSQPIISLSHESEPESLQTLVERTETRAALDSATASGDGAESKATESKIDLAQSQLHASHKWRDLTKTLVRISNKMN